MSNRKVMIIHLIFGLIKKILHRVSYFPESFNYTLKKIRVELNLANYAKKFHLKKHMLINLI